MSAVRKTITLTDKQDESIKAQIEAGNYTNDSECFRDLIRREQGRTAEVKAMRKALIAGGVSDEPQRFDAASLEQGMVTLDA